MCDVRIIRGFNCFSFSLRLNKQLLGAVYFLFLILKSMFDKILLGKRILSDSKCVNVVSIGFE